MSAQGGKGGGGSSSAWGNVLGEMATQINREVDPVRKMFLSQMHQILSGDQFTNSSIPLIQSGVRNARDAGAASMQDTQKYLAQSGASQSPFAAAVQSMTSMGTEQNIASVPGDVSASYINGMPGMISGLSGDALSGMGGAAQSNFTYHSNNMGWNTGDIGNQLMQGAGSAIGGMMMGM